jgi:hypothetical protein
LATPASFASFAVPPITTVSDDWSGHDDDVVGRQVRAGWSSWHSQQSMSSVPSRTLRQHVPNTDPVARLSGLRPH